LLDLFGARGHGCNGPSWPSGRRYNPCCDLEQMKIGLSQTILVVLAALCDHRVVRIVVSVRSGHYSRLQFLRKVCRRIGPQCSDDRSPGGSGCEGSPRIGRQSDVYCPIQRRNNPLISADKTSIGRKWLCRRHQISAPRRGITNSRSIKCIM
jgi:hypothetical protein